MLLIGGSCVAAGYTNTCCSGLAGSCQGSPSFCYCDANCRLFDDCCSDVPDDCDEQGRDLLVLMKH